jgi:hypothetical protein
MLMNLGLITVYLDLMLNLREEKKCMLIFPVKSESAIYGWRMGEPSIYRAPLTFQGGCNANVLKRLV